MNGTEYSSSGTEDKLQVQLQIDKFRTGNAAPFKIARRNQMTVLGILTIHQPIKTAWISLEEMLIRIANWSIACYMRLVNTPAL